MCNAPAALSPCAVRSTGSVDIYTGEVKTGATVALSHSDGVAHVSAANTNANFGAFHTHPFSSPAHISPRFVHTDHFTVKFHGDASWLYNILLGLLKGTLRKAIAKGVNGALNKAIDGQ